MIHLRKAALDDIRRVFELSNDPKIREVSFNSNPIEWKDHKAWYESAVGNDNLVFLLGFLDSEMQNEFVGQIRFRCNPAQKQAELSISLHADQRGKGLGRELLLGALLYLKKNSAVQTVLAQVKASNLPSNRLFLSSGFQPLSHEPNASGDQALTYFVNL